MDDIRMIVVVFFIWLLTYPVIIWLDLYIDEKKGNKDYD
jgi:hypothetical protein